MAAILYFTHNAMFKVISDHTTRSGKPKNPIVDTKSSYSVENYVNLKFDLCQMAAILENGQFLSFAVNRIKTPSRILMLEVSCIQINRQNLCLKRCVRDFIAGPALHV